MSPADAIAADLRRTISGGAVAGAEAGEAMARDFGGLIRRVPAVVVRPASAADVAATLRYASDRSVPVTARGAGHSMGGQSLREGGIQLDLSTLDAGPVVAENGDLVEASAGNTWAAVIEASVMRGLVPPVLTKNPRATVGGTHSVGGLGTTSFAHGAQVDNCLGLELATAQGDVAWCSADDDPDLFHHARAGLGQFGVITRVRHRLRPLRPTVRTWTLVYEDFAALQHGMSAALDSGVIDDVGATAAQVDGRWLFVLRLAREAADYAEPEDVVANIGATHRLPPEDTDAETHARQSALSDRAPLADEWPAKVHPWIDTIMPWDTAGDYVADVLADPPTAMVCTYAFWPLRRAQLTAPLLVTPDAPLLLGVSVLPVVAEAHREGALAAIAAASLRGVALGGKRYLSGWLGFDAAGWRAHFGAGWNDLVRAKHEHDPAGVLNPDLIPLYA